MSHDDSENVPDVSQLRQELKQWEKRFIAAHQGRKPGRDDIKQDASIAAKYKEYDRLRRPLDKPALSARAASPATRRSEARALRERPTNALSATPKRTPSKRKLSFSHAAALSPTRPEIEPTPAFIRCALGPTPQKDGQVLGIFDMLSAGTPSKPASAASRTQSRAAAAAAAAMIERTPSKPAAVADLSLSRTPQSTSRRFYLDAFAGTPLKRKRDSGNLNDHNENDEGDDAPNTLKRTFATPSFLRRSFPLASTIGADGIDDDEDDEDNNNNNEYRPTNPGPMPPAPFRKRGLARSLSSIIQGLRQQEEERMDDEWDILNEIEEEEGAGAEEGEDGQAQRMGAEADDASPHNAATARPRQTLGVPGEESQTTASAAAAAAAAAEAAVVEMPLGPDQAVHSDDDDDENNGHGTVDANGAGFVRKPWKKKGLKRQTRRVIMRPVVHKPQKAADVVAAAASAATHTSARDDQSGSEYGGDGNGDGDDDDEDGEEGVRGADGPPSKRKKARSSSTTAAAAVTAQSDAKKEGSKLVKGVRKISAQAHANFRKLKIKNKNSKANGRGRFGRR